MSSKPIKSVEGYIVFCRGIKEDANQEEIEDLFGEYGNVKNMQIIFDRQTANLKGYALIEYEKLEEAQEAIKNINGKMHMGKKLLVDFAFKESPIGK